MRVLLIAAAMLVLVSRAIPTSAANPDCMAWCAQAEADCSLSVRESKKACAQHAATAGIDPFTGQREDAAYLCGWFRGNHCSARWAGPNCTNRMRARLDLCLSAYAPNTAAEYLACTEGERKALGLCRAEMSDCQAQCN